MGKSGHDLERIGNDASERKELSPTGAPGAPALNAVGVTLAIPEKRNRLLCRLEDARALANNLVETGTVSGLLLRIAPPTESGVWDFSQYRDAAGNELACYVLEWLEMLNPSISTEGANPGDVVRDKPIRFSIFAALAFEQWVQSRNGRWQKVYIGPEAGDLQRR